MYVLAAIVLHSPHVIAAYTSVGLMGISKAYQRHSGYNCAKTGT